MALLCWIWFRACRRAPCLRQACELRATGCRLGPDQPAGLRAQQPSERTCLAALRKHRALERPLGHTEMLRQQTFHDGTKVESRLEIPVLVQFARRESRPVCHHAAAFDCATYEVGRGRGPM